MSTKAKKALRAIPKALADELAAALKATDPLGDERPVLLARLRRNRAKSIAAWGICNIGTPVADLEAIPIENLTDIQRLDAAFGKLYHYKNGGAGDYAAKDVETAIRSHHASQPRKRENNYKEIADYLRRRNYIESSNKKALVEDARQRFAYLNEGMPISESTIRSALREHGLVRSKKKPTVT
jgi:hypothetical protein